MLCIIDVAFDGSLWDKLPVEEAGGTEYRVLRYAVVMRVTAGSLLWSIEVDEHPYGVHQLEITYE